MRKLVYCSFTVLLQQLLKIQNLYEYFLTSGFSVSAPLLPGHGTTPEDLNRAEYEDWIATVESAYQNLSEFCENVLVGGESMGAVLAMHLAQTYPEISGLMLFSPALLVDRLKYSGILKYFLQYKEKNQPEDDVEWQGYSVYPMTAVHEFYKFNKNCKEKVI